MFFIAPPPFTQRTVPVSGERWQELERYAAKVLGGERVVRSELFTSAPDFKVDDFHLVGDAKAHQRFAHHALLDVISARYCRVEDTPILVTQAKGQRGANVTLPIEAFGEILNRLRKARALYKEEHNTIEEQPNEPDASVRNCSGHAP